MAFGHRRARLLELWRYYQAGLINTAFGLGAYSLLVWLGMNIFVAQLLAQILGVTFNYITYSGHVFREAAPAKARFTASYVVSYLVAVGTLAIISRFVRSPYLAGFLTAAFVSFLNYFVLKYLVFKAKTL